MVIFGEFIFNMLKFFFELNHFIGDQGYHTLLVICILKLSILTTLNNLFQLIYEIFMVYISKTCRCPVHEVKDHGIISEYPAWVKIQGLK